MRIHDSYPIEKTRNINDGENFYLINLFTSDYGLIFSLRCERGNYESVCDFKMKERSNTEEGTPFFGHVFVIVR